MTAKCELRIQVFHFKAESVTPGDLLDKTSSLEILFVVKAVVVTRLVVASGVLRMDFLALDVETANPNLASICQLGVVEFRNGEPVGDSAAVCPIGSAPEYKPRTRASSREEMQRLLPQLIPDHAARVAFIVATSACWGETERARRADVDEGCSRVFIRGTKRTTRRRTVPVVSDEGVGLLRHALANAEGEGDMLFRPWGNVRRDLRAACKRAGIPGAELNHRHVGFQSVI